MKIHRIHNTYIINVIHYLGIMFAVICLCVYDADVCDFSKETQNKFIDFINFNLVLDN